MGIERETGELRASPLLLGRVRDSGFSRDRVSGVSVCADRLRSRRVRCPDSLCHSWHTKNKSGDRSRIYRGAVLRANITPSEFRSRQ